MRRRLVFCCGGGGGAKICPVSKSCLVTIATSLVLLSLVAMLHGYLFCLPFSQFVYPLELDFRRLITQLESGQSVVDWAKPINNQLFPVLHANSNRCANFYETADSISGNHFRLLLLIKSAIGNYRYRKALRATWAVETEIALSDGASSTVQVRYVFVLGGTANATAQAAINNEQAIHGDLIQQAFVDAYFNNTYKLMFAIDWAATACPSADYVLFVDDDYYISRPNLAGLLARLARDGYTPDSLLVTGHVFSAPVPKRYLLNKWYTSLAEYPYTFWPPYPTGGAFLVSRRLCRRLSLARRYVRYLRFDDVFLGILLWKLGVAPLHNDQFYFGRLPSPFTRAMYASYAAVHLDKDLVALARIWRAMGYD